MRPTLEGLEANFGRGLCSVSMGKPNHPNRSSRGPPCGDSQKQPSLWCVSPSAGVASCHPLVFDRRSRDLIKTSSLHEDLQLSTER